MAKMPKKTLKKKERKKDSVVHNDEQVNQILCMYL